jgi:hypothetical protein
MCATRCLDLVFSGALQGAQPLDTINCAVLLGTFVATVRPTTYQAPCGAGLRLRRSIPMFRAKSKQQMLLVRFVAWFLSMGGCANQAVLFIVVLIEGEYKRRSIIVLARKVIRLRTP